MDKDEWIAYQRALCVQLNDEQRQKEEAYRARLLLVSYIVAGITIALILSALLCGCAGGGYSSYEPLLQTSSYDHASEPLPPSQPQTMWVRTLGQPDQLVTVIPAY